MGWKFVHDHSEYDDDDDDDDDSDDGDDGFLAPSVAPSFFHTCVTSGKTARMEDVERFKVRLFSFFLSLFFPTKFSADLYLACGKKRS